MTFLDLEKYSESINEQRRRPWGSYLTFSATCLLSILSIIGPSSAIAVYSKQTANPGVNAAQVLLVVASVVSSIFIALYALAARKNEAVGLVRPPVRRWHNPCFVALRFGLIMWFCSMIASVVAAFQQACSISKYLCVMQKLEAGVSIIAFVMTIIILSLLEKCDRPFQTPSMLKIRPKLVCRVSSFAEDLWLDRSASRGSSFDYEKRPISGEWMKNSRPQLSCERKPVGASAQALPEGFHAGVSQTPLLREQSSSSSLTTVCEKFQPGDVLNNPYAYHAMSKYTDSNSSLGSGQSSGSSNVQGPRRVASSSSISSNSCSNESCSSSGSQKSRKATPSSSISNSSYRSPLSIMRNADYPEILVQPELRFFPMRRFSSAHDLHGPYRPQTQIIQRPRPVARLHSMRHHSAIVPPLAIRKPRVPPRLSSQTSLRPLTSSSSLSTASTIVSSRPTSSRRKTIEIQVPGAFTSPTSQEEALDVHTRMIEEAIFVSAKSLKMARHQPRELNVTKSPPSAPPRDPPPPLPESLLVERDERRKGAQSRLEKRSPDEKYEDSPSIESEKSPSLPELHLDQSKFWEP